MRKLDKTAILASGRQAEATAFEFLSERGLVLLERNYRCRHGEIDLVMCDAETIVFVEVRYRTNSCFGSALESVDFHKQSRLASCARHYLYKNNVDKPSRFDVVAIMPQFGSDRIDWVQDAFQS